MRPDCTRTRAVAWLKPGRSAEGLSLLLLSVSCNDHATDSKVSVFPGHINGSTACGAKEGTVPSCVMVKNLSRPGACRAEWLRSSQLRKLWGELGKTPRKEDLVLSLAGGRSGCICCSSLGWENGPGGGSE